MFRKLTNKSNQLKIDKARYTLKNNSLNDWSDLDKRSFKAEKITMVN